MCNTAQTYALDLHKKSSIGVQNVIGGGTNLKAFYFQDHPLKSMEPVSKSKSLGFEWCYINTWVKAQKHNKCLYLDNKTNNMTRTYLGLTFE